MSAILREAPELGSYTFVMRRYDLACIQAQSWATYDETTMSRAIVLDGVEAQTLFLRGHACAVRARRLGWLDETAKWLRHVEDKTVRPTTEPQRKIMIGMRSLPDEWSQKREIVAKAAIPDSEWRTAIAYLEKLGLVECNNTARSRKSATNRSFRYRLTDAGRAAVEE
jgi:hypothetical protein